MGLFGSSNGQSSQPAPRPGARSVNPFDMIGDAEGRFNAVYADPGVYPVLQVDVLKMIVSRKQEHLFIAEFDILQSLVPSRPAGTRLSWVANFRHDATPGNVRTFLATLMDVPVEEVDAAGSAAACSDANPCHGRLIRLEAVHTLTKTGGDFTLHNWRTLPRSVQDTADQLRAEAGFAPF